MTGRTFRENRKPRRSVGQEWTARRRQRFWRKTTGYLPWVAFCFLASVGLRSFLAWGQTSSELVSRMQLRQQAQSTRWRTDPLGEPRVANSSWMDHELIFPSPAGTPTKKRWESLPVCENIPRRDAHRAFPVGQRVIAEDSLSGHRTLAVIPLYPFRRPDGGFGFVAGGEEKPEDGQGRNQGVAPSRLEDGNGDQAANASRAHRLDGGNGDARPLDGGNGDAHRLDGGNGDATAAHPLDGGNGDHGQALQDGTGRRFHGPRFHHDGQMEAAQPSGASTGGSSQAPHGNFHGPAWVAPFVPRPANYFDASHPPRDRIPCHFATALPRVWRCSVFSSFQERQCQQPVLRSTRMQGSRGVVAPTAAVQQGVPAATEESSDSEPSSATDAQP